jgi:hypothetical protein
MKIKEKFYDFEHQLFVRSFYCYLNYNKNTDFVVDLDNIWNWLGFSQKYNIERVLDKFFIINVDYKIALHLGEMDRIRNWTYFRFMDHNS